MRPEVLYPLFYDVARIKGVGPALKQALVRLLPRRESDTGGATTIVRDLLFHLPVSIIDRRYSPPLNSMPHDVIVTLTVRVDEHAPPPAKMRGRKPPYRVACSNDTGEVVLVFFNAKADYLAQSLPVGEWRVVSGRIERVAGMLQMVHPDMIAPLSQVEEVRRVEPVYPLTYALTNRTLSRMITTASKLLPVLPEWVDAEFLKRKEWPSWKKALLLAHAPNLARDLTVHHPARERLAYDELLANQLAMAVLRTRMKKQGGEVVKGDGRLREKVLKALPYTLTGGQQRVLVEVDADMESGDRMLRLLQGDVGSGKTVVALLAMLSLVEMGRQAALMVPTEILGRQHLAEFEKWAQVAGFRVALLTGSVKGKVRTEILDKAARGEIDILIGTHALFQDEVAFADLGMVVVDEQHRFGVAQRLALTAKGSAHKLAPHILLMTATPIPRSLTLTLFGDMDSSQLTEKPVGRIKIDTRAVPLARIDEVVTGLKRALNAGSKIYWICPLVEEKPREEGDPSPEEDLQAAESRHRVLKEIFGERVGLVHGRMKGDEREVVMSGFAGDVYDVLVATTVVEVGVNVPSATIIIIEHAERFGLAQLHQLRGRVGRSDKPSSCVLLYSDRSSEVGRQRLKVIRETEDGFLIAEEDLRLRGGGDVLGTKQSGLPEFRFANLLEQGELLRAARDDAKLILHRDAALASERGKALRILLYLFDYDLSIRYLQSG